MLELLSLQMNTIIMKIRGCLRELRKVSLRQTDEGLPFLFYKQKLQKKIKNFELRKNFFYIITVKPIQKVYNKRRKLQIRLRRQTVTPPPLQGGNPGSTPGGTKNVKRNKITAWLLPPRGIVRWKVRILWVM